MQGTVFFANKQDGTVFGEIKPDTGGENVLIYFSEDECPALAKALRRGARVKYGVIMTQIHTGGMRHRGLKAVDIEIISN